MDKYSPLPTQVSEILHTIQAPPRLTTHLQLVHDVALKLVNQLSRKFPGLSFDRYAVLFGAATHDVGKTLVPAELEGPGSTHEGRGAELLASLSIPEPLARFTQPHARWTATDATVEDLLVSLADKIWKGTRQDDLELLLVRQISTRTEMPEWEVYAAIDTLLANIAEGADERLEWQSKFSVRRTSP